MQSSFPCVAGQGNINKMLFKTTSTSTRASTSIEKTLTRLTFIFQLTGIQYISPESLGTTGSHSLTRKLKSFFVANVALVITECCAIIFAIYLGKCYQHQSNVATGQLVQFTAYNLMVLVLLTTILNSLFLRGTVEQIFKNCNNISRILITLNQSAVYATFESESKKTFAKLSLSFIGSTAATLIFIYQYNRANVLLWGVLAVYPYFVLVIVFSYWTLLIRLIREHLRFIKECFVNLHKKVKVFPICHSETNNHDYRLRRNQETYNSIVKLKRIYGIVYETTALVNKLIALPICLFIILIVIANVSSGYKVFLSFRQDIPVERVAVPIYTIFVSIISLCTLIFSCSSTYDTIDEILTQVHKFECSQFDRETEISTILLEFSLQIVQRPIVFMVGGFYCLTLPLLATIVTGVMTYVLLLVQFSTS